MIAGNMVFFFLGILLVMSGSVESVNSLSKDGKVNFVGNCDCCVWLEIQVSGMVSQKTEKEIQQELGQMCKFIPAQFQTMCQTIDTTKNVIMAIEMLKNGSRPYDVCQAVGYC